MMRKIKLTRANKSILLKANNLPLDLNVHSLRHTNASLLIAQGLDVDKPRNLAKSVTVE